MQYLFAKAGRGNESVKLDDLKKVHQQVNYTNTILQTVADHLNKVSIQILEAKMQQIVSPRTTQEDSVSKLFFKTDSIPQHKMEAYHPVPSSNNQYLKIISYQLKEIDMSVKGKSLSCMNQTCRITQEESSSNEDTNDGTNESEVALRVIEDTFEETLPLTINKIHQWNKGSIRN